MTNLTSGFLGIQEVSFYDGAMGIVAHTALLKHHGLVSMDLGKSGALVTIEAAILKNKTSALIERVALGTLHIGNRRMLVKRLKAGRWIHPDKKLHFLFSTFPRQDQQMQAGWKLQRRVKHVREGLIDLEQGPIQLEFSTLRRRNHVHLTAFKRRMIRRPENLPDFVIRPRYSTKYHSNCSGKDNP
jgi:hypothetical protein